jgi:hypothetical protein
MHGGRSRSSQGSQGQEVFLRRSVGDEVKRAPVVYALWSVMWHVMKDQGETYCGRFVMPGAERINKRLELSMVCAVCRQYL